LPEAGVVFTEKSGILETKGVVFEKEDLRFGKRRASFLKRKGIVFCGSRARYLLIGIGGHGFFL